MCQARAVLVLLRAFEQELDLLQLALQANAAATVRLLARFYYVDVL